MHASLLHHMPSALPLAVLDAKPMQMAQHAQHSMAFEVLSPEHKGNAAYHA